MREKKLIIVGAGLSGLMLAKNLRDASYQIKLIDQHNHHLFHPLLHQAATGQSSIEQMARPLRDIFKEQSNLSTVLGKVLKIDTKEKWLDLKNGQRLFFDQLVLAVGMGPHLFPRAGWNKEVYTLNKLKDAIRLKEQLLLSLETAENGEDKSKTYRKLTFIIIGSEHKGVELAASMAELLPQWAKNFKHIRPSMLQIHLIETKDQLLPQFSKKANKQLLRFLQERGVRVWLGEAPAQIDSEGILLGNHFIESDTVIWCGERSPHPLIKSLGLPVNQWGQAQVNRDFSIPDHPDIYIIGSASATKDKKNHYTYPSTFTDFKASKYLAGILLEDQDPIHRRPFVCKSKNSFIPLGKFNALVNVYGINYCGKMAWPLWQWFHIFILNSYKNKLATLFLYLVHLLFPGKKSRLILNF